MPDEHRVLAHLGLQAQEYDAAIRTYIPAYETHIYARWAAEMATDGISAPDAQRLFAGYR